MPDLVTIDTLNQIIFIVFALFCLALLGVMIRYYRQKQYNTYLFLICAIIFFLLEHIIDRLFLPEEESMEEEPFVESMVDIVPMAFLMITIMGSMFFLVLFFQAFESSRVLTEKNLILTLLFAVLTSGLLISGLQLAITLPSLEGKTDEEIFESDAANSIIFPLVVFGLCLGGSALFALAMVIRVFLKLRRRIQATSDPLIKSKLKRMRYAVVGMLFGDMVGDAITGLTDIMLAGVFPVLAFTYFVYLYSTSGTFILPGQSLQKFIIIGNEGMPLYSYNFQPETGESVPFDSQDVLFSGALRAISALFSEFTGRMDQALKEVTLESVVVMGSQLAEQRFLAVLLVDYSTRFFQEAFDNATEQLDLLVSQFSLRPGKTLTIPQIQSLDQIIETNFGGGIQRNYEALA
ncbi:MAG: hypothetical protein ACXAEI_04365 [Candidatus Hodarchaeales archaeon]|jgi:hypothetical protein